MPLTIRFEPIVAKRRNYPLDIAARLEQEFGDALRGPIQRGLVNSFEARVTGWEHRPQFGQTNFGNRSYRGGLTGMSITVGPKGQHKRFWVFVSAGTKPHTIFPRRAKFLRIRGGYQPHTRRGKFGGSGQYAGDTVYAKKADHPGIVARGFEVDIADENRGMVFGVLSAALARAVR